MRGLADSDSDDDTAKWVQKQKSKLQVEIWSYLMWLVGRRIVVPLVVLLINWLDGCMIRGLVCLVGWLGCCALNA